MGHSTCPLDGKATGLRQRLEVLALACNDCLDIDASHMETVGCIEEPVGTVRLYLCHVISCGVRIGKVSCRRVELP